MTIITVNLIICLYIVELSVSDIMQLQSVAAMFHYYQQKETLQLDPPIVFGRQHLYNTRCGDYFANPSSSNFSRTRCSFCSAFCICFCCCILFSYYGKEERLMLIT